ncbi:MAG: TolC family protein, partial [Bacteroidaceae bacterium]|nr:TolC family protein [Bacteroidaceae bacterium]
MSKKSLLMAVMMMVVGTPGRLMAQGRELTMSLDGLFRTAEEHNTSIKSFQSAIREAEAGISVAKAERLPDVDASMAFSYLGGGRITDRNFTNGFGVHIPHYGNNFALTASMLIYTGGAIQSGINLSQLV